MTHENPDQAFERAIRDGWLSSNPKDSHYAGNYMYMGTTDDGIAQFKHIITRMYIAATIA